MMCYLQIVAVSLNGVQYPGDIRLEIEKLEKMTDEKFKRIFTLLYNVNESLELFKKYHVEKLFDARILSVDSKFRGKGLGKEIIKRAEEVAEKNGFQVRLLPMIRTQKVQRKNFLQNY